MTALGSGSQMVIDVDGTMDGTLGAADLDEAALALALELMWTEDCEVHEIAGTRVFVDVVAPAPRLVVVGAVDFAASVCTIARAAGLAPYVIDPRRRFATPERFPAAVEVLAEWPAAGFEAIGGLDRATSVAVLTHDPKIDDGALVVALRSDAGYVGAMGSRRAQATRRDRLLALGITDAELARLAAPIGLDLGAMTAEETALAIVSEVVACRHGHDGGRLKHAQGRIHEVGT